MWRLIYEDTFNFGEDRDPPKVEASGDKDTDGFIHLWDSVLNESITGTVDKPAEGFARFTLVLTAQSGLSISVSLSTEKHLIKLAYLKYLSDDSLVRKTAVRHYNAFINGEEEQFWSAFIDESE